MVKNLLPIALGLMATAARAADSNPTLAVTIEGKSTQFSVSELKAKFKVQIVTIADPVYKAQKSYDAFLLSEVLAAAGLKENAKGDEIVFTALDGYAPNTSFEQLKKHRAYLAFQEHNTKVGQFGDVDQGKAKVSPAPFYVVWEEGNKLADTVPWPYQLASIEVVNFKQKFPHSFPEGAAAGSAAQKGFLTFKAECIRCHSINLEGGDIGPELNAPKNVTEYWKRDTLKQFIHDATAFRYKSKMPPFPQLKPADIENLLRYLEAMKMHKIASGT